MSVDFEQAKAFIEYLTGDEETPMWFQVFGEGQCDLVERPRYGPFDEHAEWLAERNGQGCGVFTTINEATEQGRKKSNIRRIRAFFADKDDGAFHDLPIDPTIRVQSKNGQHAYWVLAEPSTNLNIFTPTQKDIAATLGSDPAVNDLSRIMRLPGFYHRKGEPFMVRLMDPGMDILDVDAFRRVFQRGPQSADDKRIWIDAQIVRMSHAKKGARNRILFSCAKVLKDFDPDGQSRPKLVKAAEKVGLSAEEIERTIESGWNCGEESEEWRTYLASRQKGTVVFEGITPVDIAEGVVKSWELQERVTRSGVDTLAQYLPTVGAWEKLKYHDTIAEIVAFNNAPVLKDGKAGRLKVTARQAKEAYDTILYHPRVYKPFVDEEPGVATPAGFLKIQDGEVITQDNTPERSTFCGIDTELVDFTEWREFVLSLFSNAPDAEQKEQCLAEFYGACLLGVATDYRKALVLYGPKGKNGKSTFQSAVAEIFPQDTVAAVPPTSWGNDNAIHQLVGCRLNSVGELPQGRIGADDVFKQIITGDPTQFKKLYSNIESFRPLAGHIFSTNRLPGTVDYSDAFWDRIIIVSYTRQFQEKTQNEVLDYLRTIRDQIFSWCICGAASLAGQKRYTVPESHHENLKKWKKSVDMVVDFVDTCTTSGGETPLRALHNAFKKFCAATGRHNLPSQRGFEMRLYQLGLDPTEDGNTTLFNATLLPEKDWGDAEPVGFGEQW